MFLKASEIDGGPRVQIIQIIGGSVGTVQQAQLVLQSSLLCLLGSDQILHSPFGDQQMCFSKYLQSESETADFAPYPLNCAVCSDPRRLNPGGLAFPKLETLTLTVKIGDTFTHPLPMKIVLFRHEAQGLT